MKRATSLLMAGILAGCIASCSSEKRIAPHRVVTNPINLNYRFQPKDESRREAADPVLEYFKGYYYLFASKSGGYWRSEDLADWEYIPCTTIPTLEDYAPTILPVGDTLYFTTSSGKTQIFKNAHPEKDTWEPVAKMTTTGVLFRKAEMNATEGRIRNCALNTVVFPCGSSFLITCPNVPD